MKLIEAQTLVERLRQYSATVGRETARQAIGVGVTTIADWLAGRSKPQGLSLVKLWHYLGAAGIESPELEQLNPMARYVGRLLAFSVISPEEVPQIVGLVEPSSMREALYGERAIRHPSYTLEELIEIYGAELQAAEAHVPRVHKPPGAPVVQQKPKATLPPPASAEGVVLPAHPVGQNGSNVMMLATILSSALPLARVVDSDRCSPAQRAQLRSLMGEEGVFELSNLLSDLCSERARSERKR